MPTPVVETCSLFCSFETTCPLCRQRIPANTSHDCEQAPPQTAREKFAVGQRVVLTEWPQERNLKRSGTVTGFSPTDPLIVLVRRDGSRGPQSWHMSRWAPVRGAS